MYKIDYSGIPQQSSWIPSQAYLDGRNSYPKLGVCQNPYMKDSKEYLDWECGWCDAEGYNAYIKGDIVF